jgi:general secretion pathway protein L
METRLMQEFFLGLDIGRKTIKAVLLSGKTLSGCRVIAAEEVDINECGGLEPALKKLAENKNFHNIPCCICLPLDDVMFRQVALPFHDDNKIRKTLLFELEALIPLSKEEIVADYLKVPAGGLLAATINKKTIRDLISAVEGNLIDVSIIDLSAAALAFPVLEKTALDACGVVLDLGASCTTASFYENGAIVQLRSFSFGGDSITAALAEELSVDHKEAELLKMNGGYEAAAKKVSAVCRQFCRELKNTVEFMKLNGTLKNDLSHITVTGGGSLNTHLRKEMEDYFGLPVEILDLTQSEHIEIEENLREKYSPSIMNTALAGALGSFNGRKSFNFRQGEFVAKNLRINFKEQLRWAAIIVGTIFFLAVINQFFDYGLQVRHLGIIKKQISAVFKKNYPEAQAMVDPLQQLKTKLAENKKAFGFYEGGLDVPVVDLLKDISSFIPPSLDVVITDFSCENGIALIKGQAKNIDDVSAVKNELIKSRHIKDVTMGSTSLAKEGARVDFNLRIELK